MQIQLFNNDWQLDGKPVQIPHDAVIGKPRDPSMTNGREKAFFPNGTWTYSKTFTLPAQSDTEHVVFCFDGVYRKAMVYINDEFAGQWAYGYTRFFIEADEFIRPGQENEIKAIASSGNDSRWYTGGGIYRDVHLLTSGPVFIAPDGVKVTTVDASRQEATITVNTQIENVGRSGKTAAVLQTTLFDAQGQQVAQAEQPITVFRSEPYRSVQRFHLTNPQLWSVDTPMLYRCVTKLVVEDLVIDQSETSFGVRKLALDAVNGLRINGETVKLRGACIHHDNGTLGSVSLPAAETRRISKLKAAGFNAIRSAHHPASPALLEACDRLGMLVMDETFDMWVESKNSEDYALDFPQWWERDVTAMVAKDYNHPSVIMYSIGNEIPESGSPEGSAWGRRMAALIRQLDPTRFTTNSINGLLATRELLRMMRQMMGSGSQTAAGQAESPAKQPDINEAMVDLGERMRQAMMHPAIGKATAESFACVDIAGYNYMAGRYELDAQLFPGRIICGSETNPDQIDRNWRQVLDNNHVIGDFTWTGWDYIGEVGIGKVDYSGQIMAFNTYSSYPWLLAWTGDIDITGHRRPASYYREIVFGLRHKPFIAVQRPEHYHDKPGYSPWSWTDSVSSWSWPGFEQKPIKVEVYSDAEEIELLLNGQSLGRQMAGPAHRFRTTFDTVYQPGVLEAISYVNGLETGRIALTSANGPLQLEVRSDRTELVADQRDLAYVEITLTDAAGNLYNTLDRAIKVEVSGAGSLVTLGSADPKSEESFAGPTRQTFDGRSLAIVRADAGGAIEVKVSAEGCEPVCLLLQGNI
ncbi:MAG TPA: glycoside hydrolase family 2 [Clostridiales bacterium]|nr:glycoside hydrolase family 2 [Clostridiales bacterium]